MTSTSTSADAPVHAPLKVGILCHPTYGGSGVLASELALTLADRGHQVHLFSYDVPPRLARSSGPVQMHVAQGLPYPLFASTPHDLALVSAILDQHRAEGLDILHAHYALPHAVTGYLARQAALADRQRRAPKLVTTLHGTDITLVGSDPSYAPLTQFVLEQSDCVTAVSENLARRTREQFCRDFGSRACRIDVVRNFVDVDVFRPSEEARAGAPTVVHVSNFRAVKRVPWLVRAFARAAEGLEARLVLVGDGPEHAMTRAVVRELGLGARVLFLGERDALPDLLAPADVFALSSSDESFGLSALEAMACGTSVVATDVGGVSEVVGHGQCGLLSPVDDLEAFAANLRALLVDRARARAMGIRARAIAVERFARETVVREYEDLYLRTLSATPWPFP
jgi:N-acetyl-alpha-D-glucosaminyl L-malate synthase BshA